MDFYEAIDIGPTDSDYINWNEHNDHAGDAEDGDAIDACICTYHTRTMHLGPETYNPTCPYHNALRIDDDEDDE